MVTAPVAMTPLVPSQAGRAEHRRAVVLMGAGIPGGERRRERAKRGLVARSRPPSPRVPSRSCPRSPSGDLRRSGRTSWILGRAASFVKSAVRPEGLTLARPNQLQRWQMCPAARNMGAQADVVHSQLTRPRRLRARASRFGRLVCSGVSLRRCGRSGVAAPQRRNPEGRRRRRTVAPPGGDWTDLGWACLANSYGPDWGGQLADLDTGQTFERWHEDAKCATRSFRRKRWASREDSHREVWGVDLCSEGVGPHHGLRHSSALCLAEADALDGHSAVMAHVRTRAAQIRPRIPSRFRATVWRRLVFSAQR